MALQKMPLWKDLNLRWSIRKMLIKFLKKTPESVGKLLQKTVHQFILGMSPYPAAFTTIKIGEEEKGLKIFAGKFEISDHGKPSGTLDISKNEFKIYTEDGLYFPLELQLEGKKRMTVKDFLNGFRNFEEIKF